jgi:Animal haem peroxidase
MVKKRILLGATIHIILLMPFSMTTAQQRDPVKESLFFQLPESATKTPDANALSSPNLRDLSSRDFSTNPLRSHYRTYDGTNNNLGWNRKAWGSANIPLLLELPAVYGPNYSLNGTNRPSPRAVSNLVVDEPVTIFNARNLSTVVYLWGQFLDHDNR